MDACIHDTLMRLTYLFMNPTTQEKHLCMVSIIGHGILADDMNEAKERFSGNIDLAVVY